MSTQVPPSRLDSTKDFSSLVPSAFARANAAFAQANNSTDTWVRTQANNAFDTANAAFLQANNSTDVWVRTQANNSFNKANSAADFANASFLVANSAYAWGNHATVGYATTTYVGTAISNLVNSAPTTLDTLNELATALGNDANFSATITNMIGTANSFANGAFERANAAYAQANTGSTDTWVRTQANNAYTQANAAFIQANSSQLSANVDSFIGNGSNTTFLLTVTPADKKFTMLVVDGVAQPKSAYTISGTTLALSSAAPNNAIVELTTFGGNASAPTQTLPDILSPFLFLGI